ncbi:MAG: hypothetical protein R3F62_20570 [Planctomycetota bacterium]
MMAALADDSALLARYLDVVNRSIEVHRSQRRMLQRLLAAETNLGDRTVVCEITHHDGSPPTPLGVRLEHGCLRASPPADGAPGLEWRIPRGHLERVIRDPWKYVQHPEQLDWSWAHPDVAKTA